MPDKHTTWLTLLGFAFVLGVVFVLFAFASRTPDLILEDESAVVTELSQPTVTVIDPTRGAKTATLTIIEFGDYACDACKDLDTNVSQLLLLYPNQVRVVWKDAPNTSLHPEATNAAVAARCAGEQDAFWTYHDELFLRQATLGSQTYQAIADDLGLNMDDFSQCLTNKKPLPRVQKTLEEAQALNLTATPTIFIDEERWVGLITLNELKTLVEDRLP